MAVATNIMARDQNEIRSLLMQERRPQVAPTPNGVPWAYMDRNMIFAIRKGRGLHSGAFADNGMMFAFSKFGMDVHYSVNGRDVVLEDIVAIVIPEGTRYRIRHRDTLYTAKLVAEGGYGGQVGMPVGYGSTNIKKHMAGNRPYKLMVPSHMNGEIPAKGGEVVQGDMQKHVVVGPSNQEFSIGNSNSPQDFHAHNNTIEIFVTFSGLDLYYPIGGKMQKEVIIAGSTLIVPQGVPHLTLMHNEAPTYVVKASDSPILPDKIMLPPEHLERAGLNGEALALLRNGS